MGRPRRTKPDGNQQQIMGELRRLGFDVEDVHDLPGIYDMVVSGEKEATVPSLLSGVNREVYTICSVRVEVKSEKGKLTQPEKEYYDSLHYPESYIIARCTEDILRWFGRI